MPAAPPLTPRGGKLPFKRKGGKGGERIMGKGKRRRHRG